MRSPTQHRDGLLAGVLASLLFAGAASALEVGQKAPDFTLNGTDGKPVKLSDLTPRALSSSIRSSRPSRAPERRKCWASRQQCRDSKPSAPRSWRQYGSCPLARRMAKREQRRWQADPPVRFPPTPDAHGLWSAGDERAEPRLSLCQARLLHHRQDGHGEVRQDHGQVRLAS